MASNQNDNIPQWKKDLILRKRSQNKCSTTANKQNCEQLLCPTVSPTAACSDAGSSMIVPEYVTAIQASQTRSTHPVSFEQDGDIHVSEKCDKNSFVNKTHVNLTKKTMVQDSVLIVHKPNQTTTMVAENVNGDHLKSDTDSDSSEELQYGPGIVSILKSKYLSLTLREKKVTKPRQTILNMRRATSLENMLDADSDEHTETNLEKNAKPVTTQSRRFAPRVENMQNGNTRNSGTRYRSTTRTNDSMKRARSVETLHMTETVNNGELVNEDVVIIENEGNANHRKRQDNKTVQTEPKSFTCNGGQIINRPKRVMPILDEMERPPADYVKHTMMLFEGPPVRRTKGPRPTGEVAAKVANYKNIIEKEKNNKKNKPQITPKPVGHNKTRKVFSGRPVSPKKIIDCNVDNSESFEKVTSPTEKRPISPISPSEKVRPLSPLDKLRPMSPGDKIKPLPPTLSEKPVVLNPEKPLLVSITPDVTTNPSQIPDVSRINEVCEHTGPDSDPVRTRILSDTPDLILHSSPTPNLPSPTSVKKLTENFITTEKKYSENTRIVSQNKVNSGLIRTPSPSPVDDTIDGVSSKQINKQAVENISKACHSITFNITDNTPKTHLPRLSTVPVGINRLVPDTPSSKTPKPAPKPIEEAKKKCEAINELVSSPKISHGKETRPPAPINSKPKKEVIKNNVDIIPKTVNRPPTPVQNKNLTNREITKNFINTAKTFEQPVSKVVVSVRSVEDVVVNSAPSFLGKPNKGRNQEQTSLLFNFQDRETVPDYIAHDNNVTIRRGKREKPKPGESGVILLPDAPADEFEDDDYLLSLNGPPSPCDVFFENDNVLIDGKSSISKIPKRQKLRIQFNDDATQLFMYPSESSMLEESPTSVTSPPPQQVITNAPGHTVPSLSGSSLASYQPSKMSVTAGFQLGVTRSSQPIVAPPVLCKETTEPALQEPEIPITYSSETNADILF